MVWEEQARRPVPPPFFVPLLTRQHTQCAVGAACNPALRATNFYFSTLPRPCPLLCRYCPTQNNPPSSVPVPYLRSQASGRCPRSVPPSLRPVVGGVQPTIRSPQSVVRSPQSVVRPDSYVPQSEVHSPWSEGCGPWSAGSGRRSEVVEIGPKSVVFGPKVGGRGRKSVVFGPKVVDCGSYITKCDIRGRFSYIKVMKNAEFRGTYVLRI